MPAHPDLFADIDSMDPDAFAKHLADDVRFKFGNSEPVIGRDAVRDTWAGFCEAIDGVSHEVIEQWEDGPATIVESTVTYTRKDGSHHLLARGHDLPRRAARPSRTTGSSWTSRPCSVPLRPSRRNIVAIDTVRFPGDS